MRAATAFKHAGGIPYRVVVPGAELRMLVLAAEATGCIGVDLDSGSFVRASHPTATDDLPSPFEIVAGEIEGPMEPPDAARPEALLLTEAPTPVGQLPRKRAERLLAPLHHPPQLPLLGIPGTAVPYWTLTGDRPSLALVNLRSDARLRWGVYGPECHFWWQGVVHELPFVDAPVARALDIAGTLRPSRADVERRLGFRPRRVLVVLTPPDNGYCYKAVGALLPAGR